MSEEGQMNTYEYIRLGFDFGDLSELNQLSSVGWRVVSVQPDPYEFLLRWNFFALLERELTDEDKQGGAYDS
jgi:hypothetical protein